MDVRAAKLLCSLVRNTTTANVIDQSVQLPRHAQSEGTGAEARWGSLLPVLRK